MQVLHPSVTEKSLETTTKSAKFITVLQAIAICVLPNIIIDWKIKVHDRMTVNSALYLSRTALPYKTCNYTTQPVTR